MLGTILVAVDSSPQHAAILDQAAELAVASSAVVHVATVVDPTRAGMALQQPSAGIFSALSREASEVLNDACSQLQERGISCRTHSMIGPVSDQITLLAIDIKATMIIVGHRHLSWMQRIFDNSVGKDLLEKSPCNVLIVKDGMCVD
jgi:nucleotide-binding universal stress UspA family protein